METQPGSQFRELLREELKTRSQANPSYSLRAFAKQLGISPASLSMVMGGKCPVTLSFIEKIGTKLKIEEEDVHKYQLSLLNEKSNINFKMRDFEMIDHDRVSLIKEWYHYAILNLMRTKGFQPKPSWIAKRLGITLGEVQSAVERLEKAGLLKIANGKWKDISSQFTSHVNNKQYSEAARQNQIQYFEKAKQALEEVEFPKRNHTGSLIAISLKDLDRAKEFITKFRKQFMTEFDRTGNADEVYHLAVALFPLTKLKDK
jgi:uncharacterized protein (TIGR02147 family)